MKVGDKFDVSIGGVPVTQATVETMEDGIATLMFVGQRVKMSYVTQLAPEATAPVETPSEPSTQTIVTGVDRRDADGNIILSTGEPNRESAPVGDEVSAAVDAAQESIQSASINDAVQAVEGASEAQNAPVEAVEKPTVESNEA